MKDERKERELLLEDFKSLGLKNKRLEDDLKGRKRNPGKRVKLTKNIQRDLEKARKQKKEQLKLTKYWKEQTKELRGKIVEERQAWEDKYKTDIGKHFQENAELKIKLRAERIGRAKLPAKNQSILDALRTMKQSLVEHENFIVELQRENAYQNVMHEKALVEAEGDREAWKAQCLARQLYIRHTTQQIYKAVHKAHDMLEKVEALYREVIPTGKNKQWLVNFLEEARNHYEQVKAFYGYNCNMLNNV